MKTMGIVVAIIVGILVASSIAIGIFLLVVRLFECDVHCMSARAEHTLGIIAVVIGLLVGCLATRGVYKWYTKETQAKVIAEIELTDGTKYSEQSDEIKSIYDSSTKADPSRFNVDKVNGSSIEVSKAHIKKVTYADGTVTEMK